MAKCNFKKTEEIQFSLEKVLRLASEENWDEKFPDIFNGLAGAHGLSVGLQGKPPND